VMSEPLARSLQQPLGTRIAAARPMVVEVLQPAAGLLLAEVVFVDQRLHGIDEMRLDRHGGRLPESTCAWPPALVSK
jgi:hypothetical protein